MLCAARGLVNDRSAAGGLGLWQVTARGSSGLRGPSGRINVSLSTTGLRHTRLYLPKLAVGLVLGGAQDSAPSSWSAQGPMTPPAQSVQRSSPCARILG